MHERQQNTRGITSVFANCRTGTQEQSRSSSFSSSGVGTCSYIIWYSIFSETHASDEVGFAVQTSADLLEYQIHEDDVGGTTRRDYKGKETCRLQVVGRHRPRLACRRSRMKTRKRCRHHLRGYRRSQKWTSRSAPSSQSSVAVGGRGKGEGGASRRYR